MARTVDLFIDHSDLHQLLTHVGAAVRRPPTLAGGCTYDVHLGDGMVGRLGPTVSDGGDSRRFRRFGWQLSAASAGGCTVADDPVTAAVRIVADALRRQHFDCLLVVDLQYDRRSGAPVNPPAGPATGPDGPNAEVAVGAAGPSGEPEADAADADGADGDPDVVPAEPGEPGHDGAPDGGAD